MGMLEGATRTSPRCFAWPIGIGHDSVTAGRALSTYLCCSLFLGSAAEGENQPPARALLGRPARAPLALALSWGPATTLPYRDAEMRGLRREWPIHDRCRVLSITPLMRASARSDRPAPTTLEEASPEGQRLKLKGTQAIAPVTRAQGCRNGEFG